MTLRVTTTDCPVLVHPCVRRFACTLLRDSIRFGVWCFTTHIHTQWAIDSEAQYFDQDFDLGRWGGGHYSGSHPMVFQHSDRPAKRVREATESDISFYQLSRRLGPVECARSRLRAAGSAGANGRRTARGYLESVPRPTLIVKPRRGVGFTITDRRGYPIEATRSA